MAWEHETYAAVRLESDLFVSYFRGRQVPPEAASAAGPAYSANFHNSQQISTDSQETKPNTITILFSLQPYLRLKW